MDCGVAEISNSKICTALGELLGVAPGLFVFSCEREIGLLQAPVNIINKTNKWNLDQEFLFISIASEAISLFPDTRS
jgi:hypothetical protein